MAVEHSVENAQVVNISPSRGLRGLDLSELWQYRDLFYFLVWRDVKTRYAQSALGVGWAVVQPVLQMIVFTVVFGNLAKIDSEGVPYAIFSFAALVPWTFFSQALIGSTSSLSRSHGVLEKIYFPRLVIPMSAVMAKLVDFVIALVLLGGLMAWFRIVPTAWALTLPVLVLLMVLTSAGVGMWLAALAVQYRDVNHAINFGAQILMYAAPVVYPVSLIPDQYRLLYAINPMVGVIEGFRSALLSTNPMPWDLIAVGSATAVVVAVAGSFYFRRMERIFADVV